MHDLHRKLCSTGQPNDFIGITIETASFKQGPLWLSYRLIKDFNVDDLWDIFYKSAQSNQDFSLNEGLSINCCIVKNVRGKGRVKLSFEDVKKRSILTIRNDDNLCLPRSIVTAYIYSLRGNSRSGELHVYWKKISDSRQLCQKENALDLMKRAQITISQNGADLNDVHRFQKYFVDHAIALVVYAFKNFGRGGAPLYDGRNLVIEKHGEISHILRLIYYESSNHFQPILNLVGACGSSAYCEPCNKAFDKIENHKCESCCSKCMQIPTCEISCNIIKCPKCLRSFYGQKCFENHQTKIYRKKLSTCDALKICNICWKMVRHTTDERLKHECGKSFCQTCNEKTDIGHLCYMQPLKVHQDNSKYLYVFYDFETQQCTSIDGDDEKKIHTVTLCILHKVCTDCLEMSDISVFCNTCGVREFIFDRDPVNQMMELLKSMKNFRKIVVLAHNSSGFDGQFILRHFIDWNTDPNVILNGSKIIMLQFGNMKFIDSLNYFFMPLSGLPKAYGLDCASKGYFPHLFNKPQNQNYIGVMPPMETYTPNTMSPKDRETFISWYNDQIKDGYIFNFKQEIIKYCKQDVNILRLACLTFRKMFLSFHVDPFLDCTTIASTCLRVFRKNFLQKNQIGLIPMNGYRFANTQSEKAIKWLFWMEKKVLKRPIQHAGNSREKRLIEGPIVDGFCEPQPGESHRGTVLSFLGCYWHFCILCFPRERHRRVNSDEYTDLNAHTEDKVLKDKMQAKEIMNMRYESTCAISAKIKSCNYNLIEIWECEFDKQIQNNADLREFLNNECPDLMKQKALNPRDSFYGGRTCNNIKLYECKSYERIRYVDVCSLYPFVNKTAEYPVGHPKVYVGDNECKEIVGENYNCISNLKGLIKCDVLPPRNLYHPVLPVRMRHKLLFPLCRSCAEQCEQKECPHENPLDRMLTGTWVSFEVQKACDMGYKILKIYEIWQYSTTQYNRETRTGGIFAEYINTFFERKTYASGFPPECVTDEDKDRYIDEIRRQEGIDLDKSKINFNPGLRSNSKLLLNSLWGKLGEAENKSRTEFITHPEKLLQLLTTPEVEVTSLILVKEDNCCIKWRYREESKKNSAISNVVLAAFTTAHARLKLYEYLQTLDERALYYDTDSVFYVTDLRNENHIELPVGSMLGELTDELSCYGQGSYIKTLVSGGPKFYAYEYVKGKDSSLGYICKVKGIRLNFENSDKMNFKSIREMIVNPSKRVVELSSTTIRRTPLHQVITSKEIKKCQPVYGKRRYEDLTKSYPFGYKKLKLDEKI